MMNCLKINQKLKQFDFIKEFQSKRYMEDAQCSSIQKKPKKTKPSLEQNLTLEDYIIELESQQFEDHRKIQSKNFNETSKNFSASEKCCNFNQNSNYSSNSMKKLLKNKFQAVLMEIEVMKRFRDQVCEEIQLLCCNFSYILELASSNICEFANKKLIQAAQNMSKEVQLTKNQEIYRKQKLLVMKDQQIKLLKNKITNLSSQNSNLKFELTELTTKISSHENLYKQSITLSSTQRTSNPKLTNDFRYQSLCNQYKFQSNPTTSKFLPQKQRYHATKITQIHNKIDKIQLDLMKDITLLSTKQF